MADDMEESVSMDEVGMNHGQDLQNGPGTGHMKHQDHMASNNMQGNNMGGMPPNNMQSNDMSMGMQNKDGSMDPQRNDMQMGMQNNMNMGGMPPNNMQNEMGFHDMGRGFNRFQGPGPGGPGGPGPMRGRGGFMGPRGPR